MRFQDTAMAVPTDDLLEAWDTISHQSEEIRSLKHDKTLLNEDLILSGDREDLSLRVRRNPKISHAQCRIYLGMIDVWPQIMIGESIEYEPWKLRLAAGDLDQKTVSSFITDMISVNAIYLDDLTGMMTANPDVFLVPEDLNLKELERQRKVREEANKRNAKIRQQLQIIECEECGSKDLSNDVTTRCKKCGHVHETIANIPSKLLTIKPDEVEMMNDAPLEFTETQYIGYIAPKTEQQPLWEGQT